jgi:hypothetical protein
MFESVFLLHANQNLSVLLNGPRHPENAVPIHPTAFTALRRGGRFFWMRNLRSIR